MLLFVNVVDRKDRCCGLCVIQFHCCPTNASEPSVAQERIKTATAERVRTPVTISAGTGHPCHVQIINLTMKTVPSECPGDGRHGMAQRGQERCRCHAATLASGWLRCADTSCVLGGREGSVLLPRQARVQGGWSVWQYRTG